MKTITLLDHNRLAYNRVKRIWQTSKEVAVVQATGTGKSYLIARILQDFALDRKVVIAPSIYILNQLKERFGFNDEQTIYLTYSKTYRLTIEEIKALKPKLIVLDEYHRAGAEEWGKGIAAILKQYPKVYKFGTTATPIRHLDDARDMSKELFSGNLANDMNLAQAIAKGILPSPKYVSALYSLNNIVEDYSHKIKEHKRYKGNKQLLFTKLDDVKLDFEKSHGIPDILKKHLNGNYKKLVVFLKDYQHLLKMEPIIKGWFKQIGIFKAVNTYRVVTAEPLREKSFLEFKKHKPGMEIDLLLSVNMFNEGLHIEGVTGVVLLRETESPNIFYQQIGRCLTTTYDNHPIIFDLVNNFKNVHADSFLKDLEYYREQQFNNRYYEEEGIEPPEFSVIDETLKISELFNEIKFALDIWEQKLAELKLFRNENGHLTVPYLSELGRYVAKVRISYRKGQLPQHKIAILNKLGIDWNPEETNWDRFYEQLCEFKKQYGHCRPYHLEQYMELRHWCYTQRVNKRSLLLSEACEMRLNKLHFQWSIVPSFEEQLEKLKHFKQEHGDLYVNVTNPDLGKFVVGLRKSFQQGLLSQNEIDALTKLGFDFETKKYTLIQWLRMYEKLVDYYEKYGDCLPPDDGPLKKLHYWCAMQRARVGWLNSNQKKLLNKIGFVWNVLEESFEKKLVKLETYHKRNGHLNVLSRDPDLGSFITTLRTLYRKNSLSAHVIERMNKLGIDWNPKARLRDNWLKMYDQLCKYKNQFGNCIPPEKTPYLKLHYWCQRFRSTKDWTVLPNEHKFLLNKIGFERNLDQIAFEEKLSQLLEYKKVHGNLIINAENSHLRAFMQRIRKLYKSNKLNETYIKALNDIEIDWDPANTRRSEWLDLYEKLKAFKIRFGHCEPPDKKPHHDLHKFCNTIRHALHIRRLSQEKIELLNRIGFDWKTKVDPFPENYARLVKFKKENGHLIAPYDSDEGKFIQYLRRRYKEGKLSNERILKINELGNLFNSTLREDKRMNNDK